MKNRRRVFNHFSLFPLLLATLLLGGCAHSDIRLGAIPTPPATDKLRVVVYPISGNARWQVPHGMCEKSVQGHPGFLNRTGIYPVVPLEEVQAVLGQEWIAGWKFEQDNWALARQAAKALHADYILLPERTSYRTAYHFFGAGTDQCGERAKIFLYPADAWRQGPRFSGHHPGSLPGAFYEVKEDMLANAIRKGRAHQKSGGETPSAPALPDAAPKGGDNAGKKKAPRFSHSATPGGHPGADKGFTRGRRPTRENQSGGLRSCRQPESSGGRPYPERSPPGGALSPGPLHSGQSGQHQPSRRGAQAAAVRLGGGEECHPDRQMVCRPRIPSPAAWRSWGTAMCFLPGAPTLNPWAPWASAPSNAPSGMKSGCWARCRNWPGNSFNKLFTDKL